MSGKKKIGIFTDDEKTFYYMRFIINCLIIVYTSVIPAWA